MPTTKVKDRSDPPHTSFRLGYCPALDGLRGFGILGVLYAHSGGPYWTGQFIGIDMFFVLSGFLITVLLIQEREIYNSFDIKRFYLRRALRLLPALLLLLVVYLVVFALLLDPSHKMKYIQSSLVTLFYLSNWTRAFDLGLPKALGHTWSLSVEEQFYLLWPITLALLYRYLPSWRARLGAVLLAAIAAWFTRISLYATGASIDRLYNGLDTHGDGLLLGCALAILISGAPTWSNHVVRQDFFRWVILASVAGFLCIWVFGVYDHPLTIVLGYFVGPALTTVIILYVVQRRDSALARLLQWREIVWLGQISYGLYLWHLPIFHVLAIYFHIYDWKQVLLVGGALSFVAAAASFYLVERYFLSFKIKFERHGNSKKQTERRFGVKQRDPQLLDDKSS